MFIVKIRNKILGLGVMATAVTAQALSLGPGRGTVWIGQPVDLSFDVHPDPGTELSNACIKAVAMAGDMPISDSQVRVVPLPDVPGRSPAVRVLIRKPMDEPVLTVKLTAGCAGSMTRSYTFLADVPGTAARAQAHPLAAAPLVDVATVAAATPGLMNAARPPVAPASRVAGGGAPTGPTTAVRAKPARAAGANTSATVNTVSTASKATDKAASSRKAPPAAAAPRAPNARLVVEPLDLRPDRAATPAAAAAAAAASASAPDAAAAVAASAAASAPQGDTAEAAARLQALQKELSTLQNQLRTQEARESALARERAQLEAQLLRAEEDRYPASVFYVMVALWLVVAAALAWLWRRVGVLAGTSGPWPDEPSSRLQQEAALISELSEHPADAWEPSVPAPTPTKGAVAAPRDELGDLDFMPAPVGVVQHAGAMTAAMGPDTIPFESHDPMDAERDLAELARALEPHGHSDAWADIQQQAEFFVSVGENDHAIGLLRAYIQDHRDDVPQAYLALLDLFHALGRRDGFTEVAEAFAQHFNVRIPVMPHYRRELAALEDHEEVLADIEALWSTDAVVQRLEHYVRRDKSKPVPPMDVGAFEDLLMLLALAKTTPAAERGPLPPRQRTTPRTPRLAVASATATLSPPTLELVPPSSFGDLPATTATPATRASAPVIDLAESARTAWAVQPNASLDLDLDLTQAHAMLDEQVAVSGTGAVAALPTAATAALPALDLVLKDEVVVPLPRAAGRS